jgi:hypothetical protein
MSAVLTHPETQTTTTEPAALATGGPLRRALRWIRAAIQEMNYGARRAVEVQAPWVSAGR